MSTRPSAAHAAPEPVTPALLRGWPLPGGGSGKDDRGSVLVIGGARSTPGAALLAGTAALRAGAGRLTLAVAESTAVQVAVALPEARVLGLAETDDGAVRGQAASGLAAEIEQAAAVLVGPGLDNLDEAKVLLRELLRLDPANGAGSTGTAGGRAAMVLDAYALGCLPELAAELGPWAGRLILTPNVTECRVLLGRDTKDLHEDVPEVAKLYNAVVSCQGIIATPSGQGNGEPKGADEQSDGRVWKITTGDGGLGTSGSGDSLAGIIAGLRARGTPGEQATCWGTHLHAAAGDRLASRLGTLGYLARELANEVPALMTELRS